jgi:two-component system LytT family response regulator
MIKAIIVDDEQAARDVLSTLIDRYCPQVKVLQTCSDVPSAVLAINKHQPDLVFLDIEMPNYSGFELFAFFKEVNFQVIFATAYNQYAIKAFEVSAVDYLLKPIDIEKLEASVAKVSLNKSPKSVQKQIEHLEINMSGQQISRIALPVSDGLIFVAIDTIIALEADGAYTNVSLKDAKNLYISKNIRYFESLLGEMPSFFRVHRSSLVNINFIEKYSRNESVLFMENQQIIKVARAKKAEFENYIANYKV